MSTLSLLTKTVTFDRQPTFPLRTFGTHFVFKRVPCLEFGRAAEIPAGAFVLFVVTARHARCHHSPHGPLWLSPPADSGPICETRCCNLTLHACDWSNPMIVSGKQAWYTSTDWVKDYTPHGCLCQWVNTADGQKRSKKDNPHSKKFCQSYFSQMCDVFE